MADRILALDLGDHLGFCHGVPDGNPIYGTHDFPTGGDVDPGHLAVLLESFLIDMIKANDIRMVGYEKPIMPQADRKTGQLRTSYYAIRKMFSRDIGIAMACYKLAIPYEAIDQQSWRSGFGVPTQAPRQMPNKTPADKTARRKWMKQQTLDRCRLFGLSPKDDNAADAIGIWHHYCSVKTAHIKQPSLLDMLDM